MSGSNGRDKFVRCNREEEVTLFKTRDTFFKSYTNSIPLSAAGGALLLDESYLLNPLVFSGAAGGTTYSFPAAVTATTVLKYVTNLRSFFLGDFWIQEVINDDTLPVTVTLPAGFLITNEDGTFNTYEVPKNSKLTIEWQYTDNNPVSFTGYITENSNSTFHPVVSSTHTDTSSNGALADNDVLVYHGTTSKWRNSGTTLAGRLQTLRTSYIEPLDAVVPNTISIGRTTQPDRTIVNASNSSTGYTLKVDGNTAGNITGTSNGIMHLTCDNPSQGDYIESYFKGLWIQVPGSGVSTKGLFWSATNGSGGSSLGLNHCITLGPGDSYNFETGVHSLYIKGAPNGNFGTGTGNNAILKNDPLLARAPASGAGVTALGYFDFIDLQTTTSRFAVNSRGEMYCQTLRAVGNTGAYNNALYYNETTGEIVFQRAASAAKYKENINELESFIDSTLLYDINFKTFNYTWTPEQKEIGLIVDEYQNNPKFQDFIIRNSAGEVEAYRTDFLPIIIGRETQKLKSQIEKQKIAIQQLAEILNVQVDV